MSKTPEAKVKDDVKKYLTSIGAYWFMPVQMGYGTTTLDFLVCWKGQFIGIECKAPGRHCATPRQCKVMDEIVEAGGVVFLVNAVGQIQTFDYFRPLD